MTLSNPTESTESPMRSNPPSGTLLCILPGPRHEYKREPDKLRWCFTCRRRTEYEWVLLGDPPDVESYYDPEWHLECPRCHRDGSYFPGCGPL